VSKEEKIQQLEGYKSHIFDGERWKKIAGYEVGEDGILLNAPCACSQCQEEGLQPGHVYCSNVPAELLQAQKEDRIVANLDNSGWYWTVA